MWNRTVTVRVTRSRPCGTSSSRHRAAGAAHLYVAYSITTAGPRTPALWQDDAHAIRLAATVQKNTDWNSFASNFFWRNQSLAGALAYDAFRYAIARSPGSPS